jgi:hypothetical protein
MGESGPSEQGGVREASPSGRPATATQVDIDALADRVYRLMRDDLRRELALGYGREE